MKEFWQCPLFQNGTSELSGVVELSAGDEQGAQFVFHLQLETLDKLSGYLVFPRRSELSIFNGGIKELKALCEASTAETVIHDPRFDHWT